MRPWSSELAPLVQGDGEGGGAVHPSSPPSALGAGWVGFIWRRRRGGL